MADSTALVFQFGENWKQFLSCVDEPRIARAQESLHALLGDIRGKTFLDIGCGSGIQSLAALRLGAASVHSFDYDRQSVECSREMKRRFAPGADWSIEAGSALDESYLRSLGGFDIVYCWGVLHHTGDMWRALDLVTIPARERLALCLYDDQGTVSSVWRRLKRAYVEHPRTRPLITLVSWLTIWGPKVLLQPHRAISDWKNYQTKRGMSAWHDVIDWAGGYPYEFCKAAAVTDFFTARGFVPQEVRPFGKIIRCNEYTFLRATESTAR